MITTHTRPDGYCNSASQMSLYLSCPRAWGLRYIAGHKQEPTQAQFTGSAIHDVLGDYLQGKGPLPDTVYGRRAAPGILHLPKPHPSLIVERKLWIVDGETQITAIMDCFDPAEGLLTDHKTTSNFKWMKTTDELIHDLQAIVYSVSAMGLGYPPPALKWVYYRTKETPQAREVAIPPLKDLPVAWAMVKALDAEMKAQLEEDPYTLGCNPHECGAYGGCPFTGICGITTKERFGAMNVKQSMTERIKARKAQVVEAPAINPPDEIVQLPPEGGVSDGPPDIGDSAPAQLSPPSELTTAERQAAAIAEAAHTSNKEDFKDIARAHGCRFTSRLEEKMIQAWVEPATMGPPCPECGKDSLKTGKLFRCECGKVFNNAAVKATTTTKVIVNGELEDLDTNYVAVMPEPLTIEPPADKGYTLLVSALPSKGLGPMTTVEELMRPIYAEVAEANKVPYYRLVDYTMGEAEAAMGLHRKPPTAGVIYADKYSTPKAVLEVLRMHADTVIEGV